MKKIQQVRVVDGNITKDSYIEFKRQNSQPRRYSLFNNKMSFVIRFWKIMRAYQAMGLFTREYRRFSTVFQRRAS